MGHTWLSNHFFQPGHVYSPSLGTGGPGRIPDAEDNSPSSMVRVGWVGEQCTTELCGRYNKSWNKDPYLTTSISWKVIVFVFSWLRYLFYQPWRFRNNFDWMKDGLGIWEIFRGRFQMNLMNWMVFFVRWKSDVLMSKGFRKLINSCRVLLGLYFSLLSFPSLFFIFIIFIRSLVHRFELHRWFFGDSSRLGRSTNLSLNHLQPWDHLKKSPPIKAGSINGCHFPWNILKLPWLVPPCLLLASFPSLKPHKGWKTKGRTKNAWTSSSSWGDYDATASSSQVAGRGDMSFFHKEIWPDIVGLFMKLWGISISWVHQSSWSWFKNICERLMTFRVCAFVVFLLRVRNLTLLSL